MSSKEIPEKIKEAFKELSDLYDGKIKPIGEVDGVMYYDYATTEPVKIGFPTFYGIKDEELFRASNEFAFAIMDKLGF